MQVEVEIQKLDSLIFKTNYEQRMSSGVLAGDNDVILIGRSDEPFYTPEIVRIGLNHGYDLWRQTMYEDKCKCLKSLLDRIDEKSVDRYFKAMEGLVERALGCYVEPADASREQSVEMMLLDSCFIAELFRMFEERWERGKDVNEPIFHKMSTDPYFLPAMRRDLFRIGNQLPFFVLLQFLEITPGITNKPYDLITCALNFFQSSFCSHNLFRRPRFQPKIQNLLGLVYYTFVEPSSLYRGTYRKLEFEKLKFKNYATELQEAGVRFKKIKKPGDKLFDIKFKKNGVLEIPALRVSDDMLYGFRNLMEFEKQLPFDVPRPINDYAKFMQYVVNSPNDVKILLHCGIIDNWLGNDEEILNSLNEVGSKAEIIPTLFTYSELLENVNYYCRHCWPPLMAKSRAWMEELQINYFNSPWTFLSLLGAVLLLLLTATQTVFSIRSYYHN